VARAHSALLTSYGTKAPILGGNAAKLLGIK
jgi:hypothetical protein